VVISTSAEDLPVERAVSGTELPRESTARWDQFLADHADVVFRVIRLFADTYDERMDLFLFVCERLREGDMKRIRSFQHRPETPCLFSTYLSVVIKNLAVDFLRSREGRYRPFRSVSGLEPADQLLFEYHVRDGRPLEESRSLLRSRHGIQMSAGEASDRAGRVGAALSPSQRWRLVSRLLERRRPMTIDPVSEVALGRGDRGAEARPVQLAGGGNDPEGPIRSREAERALRETLAALGPRQRLALTLRFRDGLPTTEVAGIMDVTPAEAERLCKEGVESLRQKLRRMNVDRPDLELSGLGSLWPPRQERRGA